MPNEFDNRGAIGGLGLGLAGAQLDIQRELQQREKRQYEAEASQLRGALRAADVVVHHFTGAPKDEAKNAPCGAEMVRPSLNGLELTGLRACTDVTGVTCLGCLRALIPR